MRTIETNSVRVLLLMAIVCLFAQSAAAQWIVQSISLRAGWNAVYLEVQPMPRDCGSVFRDIPTVESVWRFNRRLSTVQFIDDQSKQIPNQPDWLTYLPPNSPLAGQSRLFSIEGGRCYLIKLADGASSITWNVRGSPVIGKISWLADSMNLVGFGLPTNNLPTLQTFFASSAALATNTVYRLDADGGWVPANSATSRMRAGEALWIHATGFCDYNGTIDLQLPRRRGLDFGRVLTEQTFRIRNLSLNSQTITIRELSSETAPVSSAPVAGSVPLSIWHNPVTGWTNVLPQITRTNIPGGAWDVRLQVRRRDMAPFAPTSGVSEVIYQSVLEISDGISRVLVPVTASR